MRHELDHIDEQIIKLLHENARTPLKTIASQVFLSSPAVSARIERLEHAGITLQRLTRQSLDITLRLLLIWKSILIRKRISIHILRVATTLLNVTVLQEIMQCLLK